LAAGSPVEAAYKVLDSPEEVDTGVDMGLGMVTDLVEAATAALVIRLDMLWLCR
jgi:hypothetical protein